MTDIKDKREAQLRVDRIHVFRQQLQELLAEGVLTLAPEQRAGLDAHLDGTLAQLAARFDVDISESQKRISLGMRILSTLGGLAFCAALVLFFFRYWGFFSTTVHVALLTATPLLGLVALRWVDRLDRTAYYTALLGLVVFSSFVLDLNVLGSMFNMAPSESCLLAWGAFALVLAYAYQLRLLLAAGLLCGIGYVAALIIVWSGGYWWSFFERPESLFPAGLAVTALPLLARHRKAVEFPAVFHMVGLLAIFLPLEVLIHAGQLSYLPLSAHTAESIYRVVAIVAAGAAIWFGIRGGLVGDVNIGSGFFALFLFDQLFTWWWDWMPKYLFFLIIGLIALALLVIFQKLRARTKERQS